MQNVIAMEEINMEEDNVTEMENPLEGINLQEIILACQAQW